METLQRTANRGSISTGYDIDNSLKFEADNNESLSKTLSSDGNKQTWTVSCWVKRTELANQMIFAAQDTYLYFVDNKIRINTRNDLTNYFFETAALFRDTSAWYHCVVAVDTTNSTASERTRVYVNGVEYSSTNTTYTNNSYGTRWNDSTRTQRIGKYDTGINFSGYLAEFHSIDGQQLAPTDFGEYDDDSGIWKPKAYTGSYGSKGFYLDFSDSANLGDDASGNSNNFTENNITAADQATDTPTNNGCTLNVLASLEGSNDITEGALVSTGKAGGGGNFNGTYGTIGIDPFNSSVDWYWEIETSIGTSGSTTDIGIGWIKESRITSGSTIYSDVYGDGISRYSSQTANAAGDIWGVLLETGTTPVFKLYRNDSLIHTSTHGSGGVSFDTLMFPYITVKGTSVDARLNFLNPASSFSIASGNADPNGYGNFEFDPKGGYALCTKNLAEYG